jgi:hypothetical protein
MNPGEGAVGETRRGCCVCDEGGVAAAQQPRGMEGGKRWVEAR